MATRTTAIYGHRSADGMGHVSFDLSYDRIHELLGNDASERVETAFFAKWDDGNMNYIDEGLIAEPDRKGEPPRVGTLEFDPETGEFDVEIWDPEDVLS